jgi:hypothetical protein
LKLFEVENLSQGKVWVEDLESQELLHALKTFSLPYQGGLG